MQQELLKTDIKRLNGWDYTIDDKTVINCIFYLGISVRTEHGPWPWRQLLLARRSSGTAGRGALGAGRQRRGTEPGARLEARGAQPSRAAAAAARATGRGRAQVRGWARAHGSAQPGVARPRPSWLELEKKEQPWRFAGKEERRVRETMNEH
jgi:hypothetical protein